MVGRRYVDRVHVLFLLQQLAVIVVSRAAFIGAGAIARAVISFHQALGRLAAAHAKAGPELVRQLSEAGRRQVLAPTFVARAQQAARRLQQVVLTIFRVVFAEPVAIANRHHLYVRPRQQFHGHRLALSAQAYASQRKPVARRHKRRAQHMTRHDRETGYGPRKRAARKLTIPGKIHNNLQCGQMPRGSL